MPIPASTSARRSTHQRTERAEAPMAIRMPISRVRWATLKASTPYTPAAARTTASPAKRPSRTPAERGRGDRVGDPVLQRLHLEQGQAGVDRRQLVPRGRAEGSQGLAAPEHEAHPVRGGVLVERQVHLAQPA